MASIEPTSGRFSDVAAEAAYAISLHGFAEEFGEAELTHGWNALVDVSPVTLRNVGENGLADLFAAWLAERGANAHAAGGALVWIRVDNGSQVKTMQWGHDGGARSGVDLVSRQWDRFVDESCDACADTTGRCDCL